MNIPENWLDDPEAMEMVQKHNEEVVRKFRDEICVANLGYEYGNPILCERDATDIRDGQPVCPNHAAEWDRQMKWERENQ